MSVEAGGGGAGTETASVAAAVCLRVPEVAVKVSVEVPAAAWAVAWRVKDCCVPGVRVTVAGEAVTPVGRPFRVSARVPEKALFGVASREIAPGAPPRSRVRVVGEAVRLKSGVISGGGGVAVAVPDPQPAMENARTRSVASTNA